MSCRNYYVVVDIRDFTRNPSTSLQQPEITGRKFYQPTTAPPFTPVTVGFPAGHMGSRLNFLHCPVVSQTQQLKNHFSFQRQLQNLQSFTSALSLTSSHEGPHQSISEIFDWTFLFSWRGVCSSWLSHALIGQVFFDIYNASSLQLEKLEKKCQTDCCYVFIKHTY